MTRDDWFEFLAGQVHLADAGTRERGITGRDRLEAVRELRRYAEGGESMSRQRDYDDIAWGAMFGGTASTAKGSRAGRAGGGKQKLTPADIRKAKATIRQERAEARKARAEERRRDATERKRAAAERKAGRGK